MVSNMLFCVNTGKMSRSPSDSDSSSSESSGSSDSDSGSDSDASDQSNTPAGHSNSHHMSPLSGCVLFMCVASGTKSCPLSVGEDNLLACSTRVYKAFAPTLQVPGAADSLAGLLALVSAIHSGPDYRNHMVPGSVVRFKAGRPVGVHDVVVLLFRKYGTSYFHVGVRLRGEPLTYCIVPCHAVLMTGDVVALTTDELMKVGNDMAAHFVEFIAPLCFVQKPGSSFWLHQQTSTSTPRTGSQKPEKPVKKILDSPDKAEKASTRRTRNGGLSCLCLSISTPCCCFILSVLSLGSLSSRLSYRLSLLASLISSLSGPL